MSRSLELMNETGQAILAGARIRLRSGPSTAPGMFP
jgi:hypothetical protein